MSKIINKLKGNFTQIPNDLIADDSLSDRARFVYCFMASKPDGWEFWNNSLAKSLGYSVDTLRKYLKELHCRGWVINLGQDVEAGRFGGNNYEIMGAISSVPEKQAHEKSGHGKTPTHSNTLPSTNKEVINTDGFDSFWKNYPNKKNKAQAVKAWVRLNDDQKELAVNGTVGYIDSVSRAKYICHASTYLNNARWEDAAEIDDDDNLDWDRKPSNVIEGEFENA